MAKYQVLLYYADGTDYLDEEIFDTEEEAEDYGCDLVSSSRRGAEDLYMSNMGDYSPDEYGALDFEVIEAD